MTRHRYEDAQLLIAEHGDGDLPVVHEVRPGLADAVGRALFTAYNPDTIVPGDKALIEATVENLLDEGCADLGGESLRLALREFPYRRRRRSASPYLTNPLTKATLPLALRLLPVGTWVRYHPVLGSLDAMTTSEPWELDDGSIVVKLSAGKAPAGGVSVRHLELLELPSAEAFAAEVRTFAEVLADWHQLRDAMPTEAMMDSWGRLFVLAGVELDEDGTAVREVQR